VLIPGGREGEGSNLGLLAPIVGVLTQKVLESREVESERRTV
jgi:hypothetical protein